MGKLKDSSENDDPKEWIHSELTPVCLVIQFEQTKKEINLSKLEPKGYCRIQAWVRAWGCSNCKIKKHKKFNSNQLKWHYLYLYV